MKNQKSKPGILVKWLTLAGGVVSVIGMIISSRLEDARFDDVKETARNEAREEVRRALSAEENGES